MGTEQLDKTVTEKQTRRSYKENKKSALTTEKPVETIQPKRKSRQAEQETEHTAKSRKELKKMRKEEKRKNKKPRRRIFPLWLRLIVIAILATGALVLGLMVGYGVIGDGIPQDALEKETWQHIIDIVKKKE